MITQDQREEIWALWKQGLNSSDIGRVTGRKPGMIHGVISKNGGVYKAPRKKASQHLSFEEREEISIGLNRGDSLRAIAKRLSRSPSTISREVSRNKGRQKYRASQAEKRAFKQRERPKACKLKLNRILCSVVSEKLDQYWSPEQISFWLKREYKDPNMHVSHETIYRSLFIQSRGVFKRELIKHLRRRKTMRLSAKGSTKTYVRGMITDLVPISERPAEVEDRAIPGHWEGDLLSGSANTHIATLVERSSRYLILVHLTGKDTITVTQALKREMIKLPEHLRRSLTWDRGPEIAAHKSLSIALDLDIYICDPQSPWQRGSNENTNGLLRQFFPKRTPLSGYTQDDLNEVSKLMNQRPRKALDFRSPAEVFSDMLQ